ncbi:M48 family metalloprotease [Magnetovibrio sp. PR-2]|uniref:M48 family metalloprotease n=1 Tax=Magnetovibrio sp. PR-2 TaxID=3120356 RepID=UPI002FCE3566
MMKHTLRTWSRLLAIAPALVVVAACSTNPATGKQSFTGFMSPAKEKQVGADEHPKMVKAFGGEFTAGDWQAYIDDLGQELAQYSELPDLNWTFTVLNDTKVNAFALPGGYVYITRGLLALASDEAEVAGVLGHEIGHVTARHTAQRYSSAMAANLGVQVLGVLSRAYGVNGAQNIAALGANLALKSYSRDQELEADKLGVRYIIRAGYDPDAMTSFFTKLRAQQRIEGLKAGDADRSERQNMLATHPRTADRILQAVKLADKSGAAKANTRNARSFLKRIDGLVFGDDPEQGIIDGQTFIHPGLRFEFSVPDGFELQNSPSLVLAKDKKDNNIKFRGVSKKTVEDAGGMEQFLTNKWKGGLSSRLKGVEWLEINGLPAVTGHARQDNLNVRRIVIEQDRDHYWMLQFVSNAQDTDRLNEPFRRTTYSFREITSREAARVPVKEIRVVTVGRGVTFDDLVASMKVDEYKAEWFEAINGIGPDDPLIRGARVKVVK